MPQSTLSEQLLHTPLHQIMLDYGLITAEDRQRIAEIQARLLYLQKKGVPVVEGSSLNPHWLAKVRSDDEWGELTLDDCFPEADLSAAYDEVTAAGGFFIGEGKNRKDTAAAIAFSDHMINPTIKEALECAQQGAKIERALLGMLQSSVPPKPEEVLMVDKKNDRIARLLPEPPELPEARQARRNAEKLHLRLSETPELKMGTNTSVERAELWQSAANAYKVAARILEKEIYTNTGGALRAKAEALLEELNGEKSRLQHEVTTRVKILASIPTPELK